MLTRTPLSSPLLVALLGLVPHLAGCLDTTVVGGDGSGGTSAVDDGDTDSAVPTTTLETSAGGTPDGSSGPAPASAAAVHRLGDVRGQLEEGEEAMPDDSLVVFVDRAGISCDTDPPRGEEGVGRYQLHVVVPPEFQQIGAYALVAWGNGYRATLELRATDSPGPEGRLDILDIAADAVDVRIDSMTFHAESDGTFDAARCDDRRPQAVAIFGNPPDGDAVIDNEVLAPTTLTVFVGYGTTCNDPYHACPLTSVRLSDAEQHPGTHSYLESSLHACGRTAGDDFDVEQTYELIAIDDATVTVRFDGVGPWNELVGTEHVARICNPS